MGRVRTTSSAVLREIRKPWTSLNRIREARPRRLFASGHEPLRRFSDRVSKARSRLAMSLYYPVRDHLAPSVQVPPKVEDHLRFFSLNVAHGRRNMPANPYLRPTRARRNLSEIADAVKQLAPDVVALQEADGPSKWSGDVDHVAILAQEAGLADHYRGEHRVLGFGRYAMTSGTALLARQPLRDPASHRFDMNWRDTKGFVVASITVPEWGGLTVDVVSVHLDFLAPAVRRRQILRMVESLGARRRPLVVLGDLNCCWNHEPRSMDLLVRKLELRAHEPDSLVPTYPAYRPRRRIDWILTSSELEFAGYHTVGVPLSDHLVLVADLHPRRPPHGALGNEQEWTE